MGDIFNAMKDSLRERKARFGIDCPGCKIKEPKRIPTRLCPGWKCKVCGFVAPHRQKIENALDNAINSKKNNL